MTLIINSGDKYNRLTILKEIEPVIDLRSGLNVRRVLCECECGNKTEVRLSALTNSHIKSCGCINRGVTRIDKKPTLNTLKTRKIKKDLQDFKFYTNLYFKNGIFSAERKVAKQKLLELIQENEK